MNYKNLLIILLLGILGYMFNLEILFWNEELIIAISLFLFFIILNYVIKKLVVLMIFQRNAYIYLSFKSLIVLNIALVKVILSINEITEIISSN